MKELWQWELDRAAAQELVDPQNGEAFVDWALGLLEDGVTLECVQVLAVLRAPLHRGEVESYVRRAIFAMELQQPRPEPFRYERARSLAERLLARKIAPFEGTRALYKEYIRLDYDPVLGACAYLDDRLELGDSVEGVMEEVRELLSALPSLEPPAGARRCR